MSVGVVMAVGVGVLSWIGKTKGLRFDTEATATRSMIRIIKMIIYFFISNGKYTRNIPTETEETYPKKPTWWTLVLCFGTSLLKRRSA